MMATSQQLVYSVALLCCLVSVAITGVHAAWVEQQGTLKPGPGQGQDSFTDASFTDNVNGSDPLMYVGRRCPEDGKPGGEYFAFVRFSVAELQGVQLSSALLQLHVRRYEAAQTSISVYPVLDAWYERDLAHSTKPRYASVPIGRLDLTPQASAMQARGSWAQHSVDISQALKSWLQEPATNQGFLLLGNDRQCWSRAYLATSDHPIEALRPSLEYFYLLDKTPPLAVIHSHPPTATNASVARVVFSGEDEETGIASFQCALESELSWHAQAYHSCTSPALFTGLGEGHYSFLLKAVDRAGNVAEEPTTVTWLVDRTAPVTRLDKDTWTRSDADVARFVFAGEDAASGVASMSCQLDGGDFMPCASPMVYVGLAEGPHSMRVRATDAAGNSADSEAWEWEVDLPPTCHLSLLSGDVVSASARIIASCSEPVIGCTADCLVLGGVGGVVTQWQSQSSSQFTFTIAPNAPGVLFVHVPAGKLKDTAGSTNTAASNEVMVTYDNEPPVCTISGPTTVQDAPWEIHLVWDEPVHGFSATGVMLEGVPAAISNFTQLPGGLEFIATVTPHGVGNSIVLVAPGSASDVAGNVNTQQSHKLTVRVASGNLYVAERGGVAVVNSNGKVVGNIRDCQQPSTVESDSVGRVFVADNARGQVRVYDGSHTLVNTVAGFIQVTGMDVDSTGRMYICDAGANQVVVYDAGFRKVATIGSGSGGNGSYELRAPMGIEVDGKNQVYIADSPNARVLQFDANMNYKQSFVSHADFRPVAVEVSAEGRLFAVDASGKVVREFNETGHAVGEFGAGLLVEPTGVEVDTRGNIYVADKAGSIVVFNKQREHINTIRGFESPVAVGIYRDEVPPECVVNGPDAEQDGPFNVTFSWSEAVDDFTASKVLLGSAGGSISTFGKSNDTHYAATIQPSGVGAVTVVVPAGSVTDITGNQNVKSNSLSVVHHGGSCAAELGCQWQLAQYEYQLSLERARAEADLAVAQQVELVKLQEAVTLRQEGRRHETEARLLRLQLDADKERAELDKATARERALTEADGRIREARENEDVTLRQIAAQGHARQQMVEAALSRMGQGIHGLLLDPRRLMLLAGAVSACVLAYFMSKAMAQFATKLLQSLIGKPRLVRETSAGIFSMWRVRQDSSKMFDDIVLADNLYKRLQQAASSIANQRHHHMPFRHMLFYGPPGTGKTMAAERLARSCGMDYAIMSGGDVGPLGRHAVTELHKLFDWAARSRRGLLLFIDEADAFLRRRDASEVGAAMGEQLRSALNAVLYRTGCQTSSFLLVLASNRPGDLDAAVADRVDEWLEFDLPALPQRRQLLELYYTQYLSIKAGGLLTKRKPTAIGADSMNSALVDQAAKQTEGFSGRELAKLMAALQAAVFSQEHPNLTAQLFEDVIKHKVQEHHRKATIEARHHAALFSSGLEEALGKPAANGAVEVLTEVVKKSKANGLVNGHVKHAANGNGR
eukprot:jgi/Chlat1/5091/Chrsp33S05022